MSLSEEAHCGGPRGRAPLLGTLGYERKYLGMGSSLHVGSVGHPGLQMAESGSGGGAFFSMGDL